MDYRPKAAFWEIEEIYGAKDTRVLGFIHHEPFASEGFYEFNSGGMNEHPFPPTTIFFENHEPGISHFACYPEMGFIEAIDIFHMNYSLQVEAVIEGADESKFGQASILQENLDLVDPVAALMPEPLPGTKSADRLEEVAGYCDTIAATFDELYGESWIERRRK